MGRGRRFERPQLALPGLVALALEADLHQERRFARALRQEIHLEAFPRAHIGDLVAAPFQLEHHGGLERSAVVRPAAALEECDQPRIHWIGLAGIHHPLPLGGAVHGHRTHEEGILEVRQVVVQRVLADRHPLRAQRVVVLLDRERAAGVGQELPLENAQRQRVADGVALDHIAQDQHIHIAREQGSAVAGLRALRLGEAALDQVAPQPLIERRPIRRLQAVQRPGRLGPGVAQRLAEAERVNQHLHRATAQAGRYLAGEELGRGAGDEQLDTALVHEPADEPLPAGHRLRLVEVDAHPPRGAQAGELAPVLLEHPAKVGHREPAQALVLERQEELRLSSAPRRQPFGAALRQERSLAAPADTDDREGLALDAGQAHIAPRQGGRLGGQRLGELQAQEVVGDYHRCKDTVIAVRTR